MDATLIQLYIFGVPHIGIFVDLLSQIGGGYHLVSVLADLFPEKLTIDWGNYSYRRIPKKQRESLLSKGVFSEEQIEKIEEKSKF